jgi:NAD(P)-dependent dehydrogenase (short-subunit alcohol dehydrogenase family)
MIYTPLWKHAAHALSFSNPKLKEMSEKESFDTQIQNVIPLKRPQTAEDIGNAVVFLASAEAENITGQALNVDGGAVFS